VVEKELWGFEAFERLGPGVGFKEELEEACRRELKEDMNSMDPADSPSRLLKCSAAS
jgi:hypothetical protein